MRERTTSVLFTVLGHLSLGIGIIGVFLPVLPTTPFVLLACACYARGSERFHKALLNHGRFGPIITDWEKYGVVRTNAKILAVVMIAISIGFLTYVAPISWVKASLVVIGVCVSGFILTRPSRRKDDR